MARLVPWDSGVRPMVSVSTPTVQLRQLKPSKLALWRRALLRQFEAAFEYCETQPRIQFWGSIAAVALLSAIFAFIFQQFSGGVLQLATEFIIRFGLVLALLSALQLLRGTD